MKSIKINSKISDVVWNLSVNKDLSKEDVKFIEEFNPTIYHNDLESYLWIFDEQLPSGLWLENVIFNNEITEAKGLILN